MGCSGCSVAIENGKPSGCGSKGNCSTGGCNRMNTFDWLSQMEIIDVDPFNIVEVSFKNGARKSFFIIEPHVQAITGDQVAIDSGNGYDIGKISLSGDLVRMQMKRKKVKEDQVLHKVLRIANERDLERLQKARSMEKEMLVKARVIARTLDLDMKIGDVEYQGDMRKATFFYTANGRVDFRELIRHFAKDFRVKIEMRQIGARQESARIGGIGSCGRELCCSTWLTDFKSVSTAAARYQNLAINQAKLSGQCGRLKCCLNYELDTYMEAVKGFPQKADKLYTESGTAILIKTDIFKQIMFYTYQDGGSRGKLYPIPVEEVKKVLALNKNKEKPFDLSSLQVFEVKEEEETHDYEDVTGVIELPVEKRRKKKRSGRSSRQNRSRNSSGNRPAGKPKADSGAKKPQQRTEKPKEGAADKKNEDKPKSTFQKKRRNNRRRPNKKTGNGPKGNTPNNNNENKKKDS